MGEKFRVGVMIVFIVGVLVFTFGFVDFDMSLTGYAVFGDNLVESGEGNLRVYGGAVNYFDGNDYVAYDTSFGVSGDALFDYENTGQIYDVYFKDDPTAGQVVKYVKDSVETTFQPMALNYRNSLNMIDQVNMIQSVVGSPSGNKFVYADAYGSGIDLEYSYLPEYLKENLVIGDFSDLVLPQSYITDQPGVTLDLDFVFSTNSNHLSLDGVDWDKKSDASTQEAVLIKDDAEDVVYSFSKPYAYDSAGESVELTYEFKKSGQNFFIIVKTPYDWLSNVSRVYPVYIDPSIVVDGSSWGEDAYVSSGGDADKNFGSSSLLKVGAVARSYVNFNISLVPQNQAIDEVILCLYVVTKKVQLISVNHVYSDFNESDLTWNNQPCGVDLDNSAECNLTTESSVQIDSASQNTWACWNVTEMVKVDYESAKNYSSMIFHTSDSDVNAFNSKEASSNFPYMNISYHTANTAPVITIGLPWDGANYNYNETLILNFSIFDNDANVDSCWYNIDDGVNVSLFNCLNSTFDVSGNGNYELNVYVNDSFGEEAVDSINFNVDLSGVFLVISEPNGTKDSRTGIGIGYSVMGADDCWYNVETSIGGLVIGNTSLVGCGGSSFDVASDGDYVLNLFGNNSLGSFGFDSSDFSVDTSSDPVIVTTPSGGSSSPSGGIIGGASSIVAKLEIDNISAIISFGEEKSLVAIVKNVGRVSANKCSLVSDGDYVDSDDLLNIGVGEIVEFGFILSAAAGVSDLELSLKCLDNISAEVPLAIILLVPELDVSIDGISIGDDNEIIISYSIEPVDSGERVLYFRIINSVGGIVKEVSQDVLLVFGEVYSRDIVIDLSDVPEGMLKISIGNEERDSYVEEDFIYKGSITGFVGLNIDGNLSLIGIMLLVFLVLFGFIVRRIWVLKKK